MCVCFYDGVENDKTREHYILATLYISIARAGACVDLNIHVLSRAHSHSHQFGTPE